MDISEKYFDHLIFPTKNFADFYFSHFNLNKNFDIIGFGVKKNLENSNKIFNPNKKINFIFVGGGSERKGWKLIENSFDKILKKYENMWYLLFLLSFLSFLQSCLILLVIN